MNWTRVTKDTLPDEGRLIDWIAPGGEQIDGGKRLGNLWFLPCGTMYCYYTPTYWRYRQTLAAKGGK